MLRYACGFLALLGAPLVAQQPVVLIRQNAPGTAGALLDSVLSSPYVVRHEAWNTRLFRDSVFNRSVVVIGTDATVASTVHGDMVVVNGNLFLQSGATIDGRAVAIGGGVYDVGTPVVRGARRSFRDTRYHIAQAGDTLVLDFRAPSRPGQPVVSLPGIYGVRMPGYSRVDGLALPWGPHVALHGGRLSVEPTITYRSDLGALDPALDGRLDLQDGFSAHLFAGRTTLTNDSWISPGVGNSVTVLVAGHDYRDYWRGDRVEGRVARQWKQSTRTLSAFVGLRTERDWSASAGGPWSIWGQESANGMRRFNPPVAHGRLTSAMAGGRAELHVGDVDIDGRLDLEQSLRSPTEGHFTQATLNARVAFPTFGTQRFEFRMHLLLTAGDSAPLQRQGGLGGAGTLPTFGILAMRGDELAYLESAYEVPVPALALPWVGAPVVSFRDALGAAGVGRIPTIEQNLIARVALSWLRFDYAYDPASHRDAFAVGFVLPAR
jgi:hypothetical protein